MEESYLERNSVDFIITDDYSEKYGELKMHYEEQAFGLFVLYDQLRVFLKQENLKDIKELIESNNELKNHLKVDITHYVYANQLIIKISALIKDNSNIDECLDEEAGCEQCLWFDLYRIEDIMLDLNERNSHFTLKLKDLFESLSFNNLSVKPIPSKVFSSGYSD